MLQNRSGLVGERRWRVLVVSDVLLHREGVASALGREDDVEVAGLAAGADAAAAVRALRPDAVLLDASVPGAMAVAAALRKAKRRAPVIGLGVNGGDPEALAWMEAGLTGFVDRDGTAADLGAAIRSAVAGELNCPPRLAALLCGRLAALSRERAAQEPWALTRREAEVAELVARGLSNKEIALALGIGPATVKQHVHNILEKMRLSRRGGIGARLWQALPASA